MQTLFIQYVFLILIILALVMIANRLRLAYPIVLVLGGLALSFTSFFSHITIDPELVFFIFLLAGLGLIGYSYSYPPHPKQQAGWVDFLL